MQQFARVQQGSAVIPGLVSDAGLLDLRPLVSDITPETISSGFLAEVNATPLRPIAGELRYLAPISGIRQIPATGFNYKKHIEEMKVPTPTEPEVFLKSIFSLTGPFDPISRGPNLGVKLDWETELAIVVGREVQDITAEEAADYIFGYVCLNDISDRSTQVDAQNQQHLVRAKSRPTYCPIGPYLTTGINPMDLDLWTKSAANMSNKEIRVTCCFPFTRSLTIFLATCEWFPAISWRLELHPVWAWARAAS
jgi:2,4-didehydro-3-deoxy-L-rhamnonate hydrolase